MFPTHGHRALLLSVKPRFASAIVDGSKKAEIRRQRVDVNAGTSVVLYSSTPTRAVVATASIADVDYSPVGDLWSRYAGDVAVTLEEFEAYLDGVTRGCILVLRDVEELAQPISLDELRGEVKEFRPPQSYRFVTDGDPRLIQALVSRGEAAQLAQAALFV